MAFARRMTDDDRLEATNVLDVAYEDAYRIAKRVRECPDCVEGWEPVMAQELSGQMVKRMRRCHTCDWYDDWRRAMSAIRDAKREYRKINECEPPEPMRDAPTNPHQQSMALFGVDLTPITEERRLSNLVKLAQVMRKVRNLESGMDMEVSHV